MTDKQKDYINNGLIIDFFDFLKKDRFLEALQTFASNQPWYNSWMEEGMELSHHFDENDDDYFEGGVRIFVAFADVYETIMKEADFFFHLKKTSEEYLLDHEEDRELVISLLDEIHNILGL